MCTSLSLAHRKDDAVDFFEHAESVFVGFYEDVVSFKAQKSSNFDEIECQEQGYQRIVRFHAINMDKMKRLEPFWSKLDVPQHRPDIVSSVDDRPIAVSFVRSVDRAGAQPRIAYRSGCNRDAFDDSMLNIIEEPQRLRPPYVQDMKKTVFFTYNFQNVFDCRRGRHVLLLTSLGGKLYLGIVHMELREQQRKKAQEERRVAREIREQGMKQAWEERRENRGRQRKKAEEERREIREQCRKKKNVEDGLRVVSTEEARTLPEAWIPRRARTNPAGFETHYDDGGRIVWLQKRMEGMGKKWTNETLKKHTVNKFSTVFDRVRPLVQRILDGALGPASANNLARTFGGPDSLWTDPNPRVLPICQFVNAEARRLAPGKGRWGGTFHGQFIVLTVPYVAENRDDLTFEDEVAYMMGNVYHEISHACDSLMRHDELFYQRLVSINTLGHAMGITRHEDRNTNLGYGVKFDLDGNHIRGAMDPTVQRPV